MRAKSLKNNQILRAYMPYFHRASQIYFIPDPFFLDYAGLKVKLLCYL